jgi:tetratricopeptide (TPR) repeat protein
MRTIASLVLGWCLAFPLWCAAPQEKRPRSRREYDLFNNVIKAPDAAARLPLLDQWSEEYPETDYLEERAKFYVDAYFKSGQVQKAVDAARRVLRTSPDHFQFAFVLAALAPFVGPSDPALRQDAGAAARVILAWEARHPASNTMQGEAKKGIRYLAHQCLGWVALENKDAPVAEREFLQALDSDPTAAQVSRWLSDAVLSQGDPAKNTLGLFSLARAASYDGENSLSDSERQEATTQLEKAYKERVGYNPQGLEELKRAARQSAIPPPSFRIP